MGFSQKQFDTQNEELVDVEDEEEDEDDSEFFDESSDDVLDEEQIEGSVINARDNE